MQAFLLYLILGLTFGTILAILLSKETYILSNNKEDHTLDIDELVKAAQSEVENPFKVTGLDPAQIEIRDFIREKNIQPSKTYVPVHLIYYYYTEWSPTPISRYKFTSIIKQYFTFNKVIGIHCCKITPESIGLPDYYSVYKDPAFSTKQRKFDCVYKGVYGVSGYFIARIELEDGKHYLGRFKSNREAAEEYDRHALYHFGPTTTLNFPERLEIYEKEIKEKTK